MRGRIPMDVSMDLGDLPRSWAAVTAAFERVENLPRSHTMTNALTARRFDESQVAGSRTYTAVDRYLSVARDNHEALLAILEHHGGTFSAPWTVLRPVFESAFYAPWILDPDDGRLRRIRGLRVEVRDEKENLNHLRCFERVPEVADQVREALAHRQSVEATYRSEAASLGIAWDRVHQQVNIVEELPKLSFTSPTDQILGATMVATWRMLSGHEHGLAYAMLRGSDVDERVKIPGGMEVRITINDDAFVTAAKATALLIVSALNRLERLHTAPS